MVAIQVMIIRASYKRVRSPDFLRKTNRLYFHYHLFLGSSKKVQNMLHGTGASWDRLRRAFLFLVGDHESRDKASKCFEQLPYTSFLDHIDRNICLFLGSFLGFQET